MIKFILFFQGCYMWALQGKCLCPRITKDDCEIEKHCYWLVAEGES